MTLNIVTFILFIFAVFIGLTNKLHDYRVEKENAITYPVKTFSITHSNIPNPAILLKEDIEWLAKNIYFEARNQSEKGKLAVLNVTLNRVKHPAFPNSIKEVVTQKNPRGCQFSWYCDGKPDVIRDIYTYNQIKKFVIKHLTNKDIKDVTKGALFYHADYVDPWWSSFKRKTIIIDTHIFYK